MSTKTVKFFLMFPDDQTWLGFCLRCYGVYNMVAKSWTINTMTVGCRYINHTVSTPFFNPPLSAVLLKTLYKPSSSPFGNALFQEQMSLVFLVDESDEKNSHRVGIGRQEDSAWWGRVGDLVVRINNVLRWNFRDEGLDDSCSKILRTGRMWYQDNAVPFMNL